MHQTNDEEIQRFLIQMDLKLIALDQLFYFHEIEVLGKANFNPNQPRVPAGHEDGGQWTDSPSYGGSGTRQLIGGSGNDRLTDVETEYPDAIEEVYPVEEILSAFPAAKLVSSISKVARAWNGFSGTLDKRTLRIMKSMEDYFGGKPKAFRNNDGDLIMMRGNKKIRFDVEDPHGYKPHFHLQEKIGKEWIDAGKKHHYYFKD